MQPISLTAQWTAAIRALETERSANRLFVDELARDLAKPDGFSLIDRYSGSGVQEFVIIRTRFFDDAILNILQASEQVRQVVFVAAGMDTRAIRLAWPRGVLIYEVDQQDLLSEKSARFSALGVSLPACRIEVGADLASDWMTKLQSAGFNPDVPTLWVAEGLMFFLTPEQARMLLSTCRQVSASGSWLVVDMTSQSLLKSPASQRFLSVLRRDGVPWQFGTNEPEVFLSEQGWDVTDLKEPGQVAAARGRWPYEVYPRDMKGVSRSWLIIAKAS